MSRLLSPIRQPSAVLELDAIIRREARFDRTREKVRLLEASTELDDHEKTIAAVLALADIAQAVGGLPWDTISRVMHLIDCLHCIRDGVRAPLFEPREPVGGRSSLLENLWRMHSVVAVEAARRAYRCENIEARKRFLSDFENAFPTDTEGKVVHALFQSARRADVEPKDETSRRCELLKEWCKPRTIARWCNNAKDRHKMMMNLLDDLGPRDPQKAYEELFKYAVRSAKPLISFWGKQP